MILNILGFVAFVVLICIWQSLLLFFASECPDLSERNRARIIMAVVVLTGFLCAAATFIFF